MQVELDALPPDRLRALHDAELDRWWNVDAYAVAVGRERDERDALAALDVWDR